MKALTAIDDSKYFVIIKHHRSSTIILRIVAQVVGPGITMVVRRSARQYRCGQRPSLLQISALARIAVIRAQSATHRSHLLRIHLSSLLLDDNWWRSL